jgi:hypothetical protein
LFTWIRGSTFKLGLRAKTGAFTGAETVRCVLKASSQRAEYGPGDTAPDAAVLTPSYDAENGAWTFSGSATQGEALTPGFYIADARIVAGTEVIQTLPVKIEVVQRVTEAS